MPASTTSPAASHAKGLIRPGRRMKGGVERESLVETPGRMLGREGDRLGRREGRLLVRGGRLDRARLLGGGRLPGGRLAPGGAPLGGFIPRPSRGGRARLARGRPPPRRRPEGVLF